MKYAVITGASKGIGKNIAFILAEKKYNLIISARSEDELKKVAAEVESKFQIKCTIVVADLSTTEGQDKLVNEVVGNNYEVNVLVNNAGYGLWGQFTDVELLK